MMGDPRPFPLDGVHRLLKADLLGLGNVPVRRLPAAMLPRILPAAPATSAAPRPQPAEQREELLT